MLEYYDSASSSQEVPKKADAVRPRRSKADDRIARMNEEATYTCDACGEEIVIPIDPSAGNNQEYVEDCPVCCHPNIIQVQIAMDGSVTVSAKAE